MACEFQECQLTYNKYECEKTGKPCFLRFIADYDIEEEVEE